MLEIRITHMMDCPAEPGRIRVVAEFSRGIGDSLPYLAALLPQAGYHHEAGILSLAKEGRLIIVYPQVVTMAKAKDARDAQEVLDWLRDLILEADARRDELTPCLERRRTPHLFEVYKLLPGTNCGDCGEATCVALASRLILGEARIAACPRLDEVAFAPNRKLLAEWLGELDAAAQ